jgi:hypothetical protein
MIWFTRSNGAEENYFSTRDAAAAAADSGRRREGGTSGIYKYKFDDIFTLLSFPANTG